MDCNLQNYVPSAPFKPHAPSCLTFFSRLTRLCAFAPDVHLCFAFFFALPDLIFTRLIYAPCAPCLITRLITHAPLNVAKSLIKRNL